MNPVRILTDAVAVTVLTILFSNTALATSDETGVGIVANYRPAAGRFNFSRPSSNETIPVRVGTVVFAGDNITLPAGATVIVHLADETVRHFEGPGTLSVPDARPLGKIAAFFRSIPDLFDNEYRLSGTAASRGGDECGKTDDEKVRPIDVPILASGALITTGVRDIPIAWRGGCAPYIVTVLSDKNVIVHREKVVGRQLRLDDVALPVGDYTVVITDATNKRFETTLEARPHGPAIPADLLEDDTPLGVVAQAVWLAEQDHGAWRIDSFELLRPLIRAGNALAGTIGDGVLWGQRGQE